MLKPFIFQYLNEVLFDKIRNKTKLLFFAFYFWVLTSDSPPQSVTKAQLQCRLF